MRWIRFGKDGRTAYGSLANETVTEIAGEPWADATPTGRTHALNDIKLEIPVIPRTFYCAGINYASHIREMAHKRGVEPVFRDKADIGYRANNALIAHDEPVVIPAQDQLRRRACRRHRQAGQAPDRGRRPILRVRLYDWQRRQ